MQQRVLQSAGRVAGSGVHHEPGGFVDHLSASSSCTTSSGIGSGEASPAALQVAAELELLAALGRAAPRAPARNRRAAPRRSRFSGGCARTPAVAPRPPDRASGPPALRHDQPAPIRSISVRPGDWKLSAFLHRPSWPHRHNYCPHYRLGTPCRSHVLRTTRIVLLAACLAAWPPARRRDNTARTPARRRSTCAARRPWTRPTCRRDSVLHGARIALPVQSRDAPGPARSHLSLLPQLAARFRHRRGRGVPERAPDARARRLRLYMRGRVYFDPAPNILERLSQSIPRCGRRKTRCSRSRRFRS